MSNDLRQETILPGVEPTMEKAEEGRQEVLSPLQVGRQPRSILGRERKTRSPRKAGPGAREIKGKGYHPKNYLTDKSRLTPSGICVRWAET